MSIVGRQGRCFGAIVVFTAAAAGTFAYLQAPAMMGRLMGKVMRPSPRLTAALIRVREWGPQVDVSLSQTLASGASKCISVITSWLSVSLTLALVPRRAEPRHVAVPRSAAGASGTRLHGSSAHAERAAEAGAAESAAAPSSGGVRNLRHGHRGEALAFGKARGHATRAADSQATIALAMAPPAGAYG